MPEPKGSPGSGAAAPLGRQSGAQDIDRLDEARRLSALQKLRNLVPHDQPRLDGLCRVASLVTQSDAAGLAFVSDRFLYFAGRFGHLPDRDVRGFAMSDLRHRLIFFPEARLAPGHARVNCFNGKFASYKSMVGVAIHYDAQPVAMLACFSQEPRDSHGPEAKSCLYELAYLAEAYLAQEATLADVARTALAAMERQRTTEA